jgi:hypothetical protein
MNRVRNLEELVTLQDKAIEALTQANAALQLALETLRAARAEKGTPMILPFATHPPNVTPKTVPNMPSYPIIGDPPGWFQAPQWTLTSTGNSVDNGIKTLYTNTAAALQQTMASLSKIGPVPEPDPELTKLLGEYDQFQNNVQVSQGSSQ